MPIKSQITDPATGKLVAVDAPEGESNALIVSTRDLKTYEDKFDYFLDANGSADMNLAVTAGATPENVYDGGDKTQWTASTISGTFTHTSTAHAKEAVITVVDWTGLALDTITIIINGVTTIRTEGTNWDNEVSNEVTAENIRVAMDAITGITATRSVAVVTIVTDIGYDITSLATSAGADMTATARCEDASASAANGVVQYARGADLDLTNYISLTGWVYLTKWVSQGALIYGWDVSGSIQLGIAVNIGAYVNTATLNTWQRFTIPLTDLGIAGLTTGFDAIRIQIVNSNVDTYWDYIRIQEQAVTPVNPTYFTIKAETGTWWIIRSISMIVADAMAGTLADGTMPALAYNKILGVTNLTNGLIYNRLNNGEVVKTIAIHNLGDWLSRPHTEIRSAISDGTNTYVVIESEFTEPVILKSENDDQLRFLVADDVSGLLMLRMTAAGKVEQRT